MEAAAVDGEATKATAISPVEVATSREVPMIRAVSKVVLVVVGRQSDSETSSSHLGFYAVIERRKGIKVGHTDDMGFGKTFSKAKTPNQELL